MRGDDHRADNLLLRLFAYTPREGRLPLEDFCTEALAWCLRNCVSFRTAFLKSINLDVKDGRRVAIDTQNSYAYEDDEGSGDGRYSDAGRFDMVIRLWGDGILAIIETKVGSVFGVEQLLRYREELKRQQRAFGFKRGMLITLTDKTEEPKGADVHRTWSAVQRLLERQITTRASSDHPAMVCVQFAEFLKEKGLGPMNVPKIASAPLNQWVIGMKFRSSLEGVLKSVKNDSEMVQVFGRKKIDFQENKDGTIWIGMYGNQQDFWIGFGFRQNAEKTKVIMRVEKAVAGDRKREFPKLKPECADGKTWLNMERCLDRELDGNGEKIKEWLLDSAKMLLKIE